MNTPTSTRSSRPTSTPAGAQADAGAGAPAQVPAVPEQGGDQPGASSTPAVGHTVTVPRLVDWLQSELLALTRPLTPDHEREMRCEEYVEGDQFVLRVELPGIDPDRDLDVSVSGGVLTVRAERRRETHEHGHRSEFFYGRLARTFVLPKGADESAITATYGDGLLAVRVPVSSSPARSVPVSHGPR
ncbi:MAG TPA: Hsp20/alpha crystallin family protein [Kineosporiaceae bacterium]|nr:Hsp20/alpha crystallin family protein [Kineosporiaceae bacterium]